MASNLADWKQRLKDVWQEKPAGVDVIAWTPEEVRRYIHRQLILDVATEGVPLYGDIAWLRQLAEPYLARRGTAKLVEEKTSL